MSSPPTVLGQYQIIREIARSNDVVYEAYDPLMDRRVALKELNLPSGITQAQKEDRVQRFDREAKAAGRLAHPNIMRVFQVANDGERHFMAMEFLDGHTLRNEIDTKGFLPVDRAIEVASAVLKGLGHAHANGVVHRDIKPDNIQLLTSGEIKITDFGIARLTFQPNLTMDGQVFGTPSYMSPEQVVGKDIDARSDLFSVGVLLYEMIGGQKPFAGDSVVAITYNIMNHEPEPLKQANHSLWQVISRALDKSPALRFSSAQEMLESLESAMAYSVVLDTPAAPPGQTIYGASGPYGVVPPPVVNPYASPYGGPQQAPGLVPPPVVYPYNPYQQGMAGGGPPHTPGMTQQGFPQVPIYYPPPPRQPLLKPETRHFIGKLALTFMVMGTLFAVVILCIYGISQAISNSEQQRQDRIVLENIAKITSTNAPLEQKVQQIETEIPKLRSAPAKMEQNKKLAVLYEDIGTAQMSRGDLTNAEASFVQANQLDNTNPLLMSDLAVLYGRIAQRQSDLVTRAEFYERSVEQWQNAADATFEDKKRDEYNENAAKTYYALALEYQNARMLEQADAIATKGLGLAPIQSPTYRLLTELQDQIRRASQYN